MVTSAAFFYADSSNQNAGGGNPAGSGNVQALNASSRVLGSGNGIAENYLESFLQSPAGHAVALEASVINGTNAPAAVDYSNIGTCDGFWVAARSFPINTQNVSSAVHIGTGDGASTWKEGITINRSPSVSDFSFNDHSDATTSINIAGAHTTAIDIISTNTTALSINGSNTTAINVAAASGISAFGGPPFPPYELALYAPLGASSGQTMALVDTNNDANGADVDFYKQHNHGAVLNGDTLGRFGFWGSDGGNFQLSANILAVVSGTPSTGVMPSELQFYTTSQAGSRQLAMKLDNSQNAVFAAGIVAPTLPTSPAGLTSGSLWNNSGVVNVA